MKRGIYKVFLILSICLLFFNSCNPYVKLYDPNTEKEFVTLNGAHFVPGTVGAQGSTVYIDYKINRPLDTMNFFELGAAGICANMHYYCGDVKVDKLQKNGIIKMRSSLITNEHGGGHFYGYGTLYIRLTGYFTNGKGEEHRGWISNRLVIPVEYDRN